MTYNSSCSFSSQIDMSHSSLSSSSCQQNQNSFIDFTPFSHNSSYNCSDNCSDNSVSCFSLSDVNLSIVDSLSEPTKSKILKIIEKLKEKQSYLSQILHSNKELLQSLELRKLDLLKLDLQKVELHLIFGPMFAGKSTELLRLCRKYSVKRPMLLINSLRDTRCLNQIKTHDNSLFPALKVNLLSELLSNPLYLEQFNRSIIIGIDEAQFYPDLVEFITSQINKPQEKIFIIAGLDSDCHQQRWNTRDESYNWGDILDLVHLADSVTKLTACCDFHDCHQQAPFTFRYSDNTCSQLIGGKESYIAVCRSHLYLLKSSSISFSSSLPSS